MVIGSSGPSPRISCTRALPMEVTRNVTCINLPSMSEFWGTVVKWPSHEPARLFRLSKDFCASDFCPSTLAKVTAESDISKTADNRKPNDFILFILLTLVAALGSPPGELRWRRYKWLPSVL